MVENYHRSMDNRTLIISLLHSSQAYVPSLFLGCRMQRKEKKMERASFFKVMIGDFAEKMHIPRKFLLEFGRELYSIGKAILNGPHGTDWCVPLEVEDGRMFLRSGWREFIKHHDIQEGYFLIFRFDGKSQFDVEVFDKSACLKKYECTDECFNSCDSSRDSLEIRDCQCREDLCQTKERKNYPALRRSVRRRSHTSNPIKRKKSKSENKTKNGNKEKLRSHEKNKGTECLSGSKRSNFEVSESEDNQETQPGKRLKAEKEVVERKSSHLNPKHPHFKAVIKKINLMRPYLCIPRVFGLGKDLSIGRTMTLRDPKQRSWKVKIAGRRDGRIYFSSGWTELMVANGLKEGDVCIFEIMPSMKDVMNVQIKRLAI